MFSKILLPLKKIHGHLYETKLYYKEKNEFFHQYIRPLLNRMNENPTSVFLILTPEHNNLGDHAIALAEIELLNSIGFKYIEITGKQLFKMKKFKYLSIMNGRPILINGGGNLGSIWFDMELKMIMFFHFLFDFVQLHLFDLKMLELLFLVLLLVFQIQILLLLFSLKQFIMRILHFSKKKNIKRVEFIKNIKIYSCLLEKKFLIKI